MYDWAGFSMSDIIWFWIKALKVVVAKTHPPPAPGNFLCPSIQSDFMAAQFISMAEGMKVPKIFLEFLHTKGLDDCESMAVLAADEQSIPRDIFEMLKAEGKEIMDLADRIAIKKLWVACKASGKFGTGSSADARAENEGIPREVEIHIKSQWSNAHGFVLPDAWLLNAVLQKALWK